MGDLGFMITTDTCCDLPESYIKENGLDLVTLYYNMNGTAYGKEVELEVKEFYRQSGPVKCRQPMAANLEELQAMFESYLKEGRDILHLAFSSELSSSYNNAAIVARELNEQYTENKVIVIDTLSASLGQGLIVYKAVQLRDEGKTIDETAAWVEENKLHFCHQFTVECLIIFIGAEEVSKLTAVAGTLIHR